MEETWASVDAIGALTGFAPSTACSIWRAATCFTDPEPFDPVFGACGGEDLDLFLRLERRGRRIVWCAEAGVCETIPDERTTFSNHLMRTYSGAQAYAAVTIKNADHAVPVAADVMARGALQAAACGLRMVPLAVKAGLGRQDAGLRLRHEVLAAASALRTACACSAARVPTNWGSAGAGFSSRSVACP